MNYHDKEDIQVVYRQIELEHMIVDGIKMATKNKRKLSIFLMFTIIFTIFPSPSLSPETDSAALLKASAAGVHTPVVINQNGCPHGGNSENVIGEAGCASCGGTNKKWLTNAGGDHTGDSIKYGTGYQKKQIGENQHIISYTLYRCYNCGDTGYDCAQYEEEIGTLTYYKDSGRYEEKITAGTRGKGSTFVPIRRCSICGDQIHDSKHEPCYSEASYTMPHIKAVNVTVKADPSSAGTVSASKTTKIKAGIEQVTISATPKAGYKFKYWTLNGIRITEQVYSDFYPTKDFECVASFGTGPTDTPTPTPTPAKVNVTVKVDPARGGTAYGSGRYDVGSSVNIGVNPNTTDDPKWSFMYWLKNGVKVGGSSSMSITVPSQDVTYTAIVSQGPTPTPKLKYTITTRSEPAMGGTTTGGGTYDRNTVVRVNATANKDYEFSHWEMYDTITGQFLDDRIKASTTVTANADKTCIAYFIEKGATPTPIIKVPTTNPIPTTPPATPTPNVSINITIDPNGGSGSPRTIYGISFGSSVGSSISSSTTKTGYILTGWRTMPNGGFLVYDENGQNTNDMFFYWKDNKNQATSSYTVYAQWMPITYYMTMHTGKDNLDEITHRFTYDQKKKLPPNPYIRSIKLSYDVNANDQVFISQMSDYMSMGFLGWSLNPRGGTIDFTDQQEIFNLTTEHLKYFDIYAEWGGSFTLQTPRRNGYIFTGWTEDKAGNGQVYPGGSKYTTKTNTTLYAQWKVAEFNVAFNPNGGTCPLASKNVIYGQKYGALPTATRTGYDFSGWLYKNSIPIMSVSKVNVPNNHVLDALWIPKEFNISADPNSGSLNGISGNRVLGKLTYDSPAWSSVPVPEKEGYRFLGWFDQQTGGTKLYNQYGAYIGTKHFDQNNRFIGLADMQLYAHWEIETYTINFNPNGGACSELNRVITYGQTYGTLPVTTKAGYTFNGWTYRTSTVVSDNDPLVVLEDHWLDARWSKNQYTVTFDWNFDYKRPGVNTNTNYSGNSKGVYYHEAYGTLPSPQREGYDFLGWYTEETNDNGSGTLITANSYVMVEGNHTLYAKWAAKTYRVHFDYNYEWFPETS